MIALRRVGSYRFPTMPYEGIAGNDIGREVQAGWSSSYQFMVKRDGQMCPANRMDYRIPDIKPCKNRQPVVDPNGECLKCGAVQGESCR